MSFIRQEKINRQGVNSPGVLTTKIIKKYDDGLTKQSFKDSTDINKMLAKAQHEGSLAHIQKYPKEVYGEFEGYDLQTAFARIQRAEDIFAEAPSEIRREFGNDAKAFISFAADPQNNTRLAELLPAIAEPGKYFPNPAQRGGQGAGAATAPTEVLGDNGTPAPEAGENPPQSASGAPSAENGAPASSST